MGLFTSWKFRLKLALLKLMYKGNMDDQTKQQIQEIQQTGDYSKAEVIFLDDVYVKRYAYLCLSHFLAIIVSIVGNVYALLAILFYSIYIWYLYLTNTRRYIFKYNSKRPNDFGCSEVFIEGEQVRLEAWDKREDLELCFYYFNPLHVALLICLNHQSKELLIIIGVIILMLINFMMFMVIQDTLNRSNSDKKILQRELDGYYRDHMKVKILYKNVPTPHMSDSQKLD